MTAFYDDKWQKKINLKGLPSVINTTQVKITYEGINVFSSKGHKYNIYSFTIQKKDHQPKNLNVETNLENINHDQLKSFLKREYVSDPKPCPTKKNMEREVF